MSDLISPSELATYQQAIDDLHDTFARDIIVWHKSAETITIPNPSTDDYDVYYQKSSQSSVVYTSQSKTIKARIKYLDRQEIEFQLAIASSRDQINVTSSTQIVRIKVKKDDADYIQHSQKVTVDNIDYEVITAPRSHGLIGIDYVTFFIKSLV